MAVENQVSCSWCGRSFEKGDQKPCSAATDTELRVIVSSTRDDICRLELRERGY
jgi:hypothetical protein